MLPLRPQFRSVWEYLYDLVNNDIYIYNIQYWFDGLIRLAWQLMVFLMDFRTQKRIKSVFIVSFQIVFY